MFIQAEKTLMDLIVEKNSLPWQEAMAILSQLVQKVDQIHQQDNTIGFLNPRQIYLDAENKIYINNLDNTDEIPQPEIDSASNIVYQSPEQLRGEPTTPYSDQYTLAVIFYEMISGHLPFEGDDDEWLRHLILSEPPARLPSDIDLPPGITSVLERALSKKTDQRYEDVLAFQWALEALTDSPKLLSSSHGRNPKQRFIVGGLGVMLTVVILLLFGFFNSGRISSFLSTPTIVPSPTQPEKIIISTATINPTSTAVKKITPTTLVLPTVKGEGVLAQDRTKNTQLPTISAKALPTPIPTPTPIPIPLAKVVKKANLRRGPGKTHPSVASAHAGEIFEIHGKTATGNWLKIASPSGVVWILTSLVEIQGDGSAIIVISNPPTPPPPPIAKIKPILLSPEESIAMNYGDITTFIWKWSGPVLPQNSSFALLLWKENDTLHHTVAMAGVATSLNFAPYNSAIVQQGGTGRYFWSVVVVDSASDRRIGIEATPRSFIIQAAPPPANNGGGDNGGGNNGGDNNDGGDNGGGDNGGSDNGGGDNGSGDNGGGDNGGGDNGGGDNGGDGSRPPRPTPPSEPPPQ